MKIKEIIKRFRNWKSIIDPFLDNTTNIKEEEIMKKINSLSDKLSIENDEKKIIEIYNLAWKICEDEKNRYDIVTRKSVTILSAAGLISAIILGLRNLIIDLKIKSEEFVNYNEITIVIILIIVLIYFSRAVYYSLKVLDKKKFWVISFKEIADFKNSYKEYVKKITIKLVEYTERNYFVTNATIDNFVLARSNFQLGIFSIIILIIYILIWPIIETYILT